MARMIRHKRNAALVEFEDEFGYLRRTLVPLGLQDSPLHQEWGIPFGLPWDTILADATPDPVRAADVLRRAGIWTLADLQRHQSDAARVLRGVGGVDISKLRKLVGAYLERMAKEVDHAIEES